MSVPDLTIHSSNGTTFDLTFQGRRAQVGFLTADPDRLETQALIDLERAEEAVFRARRTLALASVLRTQEAERAEAARLQRNSRSAATRARNADPFGFKAMETRRKGKGLG